MNVEPSRGKIDKNGHLFLWRAGKWKQQYCYQSGERVYCGDLCPLFGDPEPGGEISMDGKKFHEDGTITLSICDDTILVFDNFKDERKGD